MILCMMPKILLDIVTPYSPIEIVCSYNTIVCHHHTNIAGELKLIRQQYYILPRLAVISARGVCGQQQPFESH